MASLTFDRPRDADGYRAATKAHKMQGAMMPSFRRPRCGQYRQTRGRKKIDGRWRCEKCVEELKGEQQ